MNSFPPEILAIRKQALAQVQPYFTIVDEISEKNTEKVLNTFRKHKVADYHFRTTSGYAYNDGGGKN